jgi:succinyl-diaminopimelate desuccinylase
MDSLAQRLAALTLDLCRIPSVIGEERALCDHLEARLSGRFPSALRRVGNSLVAGTLDDPRPTLALFGHLDTVAGHEGDPPPRIDGDRVVGLGASDMKGGLAVMLALAEDLDRARLPVNLVLVLYDREEGPYSENGLGSVLASLPELGRIALALCLEPTDNEIQMGCVGGLHAAVTFRGKSAHSARPWQGENAIHKAGPFLARLGTLPRRRVEVDGFEYFEVVSATLATGGRARNVVPDTMQINVNYRFAPGKSLDQAEAELRALVGDTAEVAIVDRSPSGRVCARNPHLRRLREVTSVKATSKQAWTDVARLAVHGIDAVNFGPGLTSQAHQAGELIPCGNLADGYRMLERFLREPL